MWSIKEISKKSNINTEIDRVNSHIKLKTIFEQDQRMHMVKLYHSKAN